MKYLTGNEIRNLWIKFFKDKDHHILESASLVPIDDKSLLWINSGVATLKPYFDGRKNPPAPSMANSQKSIRTNDIENVGLTARHHTLFEMLGNFSIGGYFKKTAILYAWEFLTSQEWLALDINKLYVTVYEEDLEAYNIWKDVIGLKDDRIIKGSKKTNFWDIGSGPCGPNTEIFYDRSEKYDYNNVGIKLLKDDLENDRYLEIWNIVFSQYNNDGNGNYQELPRKNIDTGAGLERLASVLQSTITNFETDLFLPIIEQCQKLTTFKYDPNVFFTKEKKATAINIAFKVISDHIRAVSFAIADGVFPSNKERGYIIRRLIRRAVIYGQKLDINEPFLYHLVDSVIKIMGDFYQYLNDKVNLIKEVIKNEEIKFYQTLKQGYNILTELFKTKKLISGFDAFKLFDTYGFPIELTLELAASQNIKVDLSKFQQLLEAHRQIAREARKDFKAMNLQNEILTVMDVNSKFIGYEYESIDKAQVVYLFNDKEVLKTITNEEAYVILDQTPFYAEKGGQVADNGIIKNKIMNGQVIDVQEGPNRQNIHHIFIEGTLKLNDYVTATINHDKRYYTKKNHSGTHLLHAAIREILGKQAMQTGSYNDENYLRLDITYNSVITEDQINQINNLVLKWIKQNDHCEIINCQYEEALAIDAIAFFNEKYDQIVRVVKFGEYSKELCGGTHVNKTGDIEDLLITNSESKGSGVIRFSALTSFKTITEYLQNQSLVLKTNGDQLYKKYQSNYGSLINSNIIKQYDKIKNFIVKRDNLKILKYDIQVLQELIKKSEMEINHQKVNNSIKKYENKDIKVINNFNYVIIELDNIDNQGLKLLADWYRQKYQNLIIILINKHIDVLTLLIGLSSSLVKDNQSASLFIKKILTRFNGNGGGNLQIAQAKIKLCEVKLLISEIMKELQQWTI